MSKKLDIVSLLLPFSIQGVSTDASKLTSLPARLLDEALSARRRKAPIALQEVAEILAAKHQVFALN